MKKVTVYLPDDVKAALRCLAMRRGVRESSLVREAVAGSIRRTKAPKPRLPLFYSDDPALAKRFEEGIVGFGES